MRRFHFSIFLLELAVNVQREHCTQIVEEKKTTYIYVTFEQVAGASPFKNNTASITFYNVY